MQTGSYPRNSTQYSMIIYVEKNLKESRYVYVCNRITLFCSRNYHNIVNQLHFNKTLKNGKRKLKQEGYNLSVESLSYVIQGWKVVNSYQKMANSIIYQSQP